jgi:hypothetical protein
VAVSQQRLEAYTYDAYDAWAHSNLKRTRGGRWAVHSRLVGVGLPLSIVVGVRRVEDVRAAHILLFDRHLFGVRACHRLSMFAQGVCVWCRGKHRNDGADITKRTTRRGKRRSHTALRLGA